MMKVMYYYLVHVLRMSYGFRGTTSYIDYTSQDYLG